MRVDLYQTLAVMRVDLYQAAVRTLKFQLDNCDKLPDIIATVRLRTPASPPECVLDRWRDVSFGGRAV
eukprot:2221999-Rhodomonas_salina.1